MQSNCELVFTPSEVAHVLRAVDGREAFSARAVRYYARTGMIEPSGRLIGARGARLYTLTDVALLRLTWLLQRRWQVSERSCWALFVYRGAELRQQLAARAGVIPLEDAALSRGSEDRRQMPASIRVPVSFVLERLTAAATNYRGRRPRLWTGSAWVPAIEAAEQISA